MSYCVNGEKTPVTMPKTILPSLLRAVITHYLFIYLFIYYKIVHTVQDRHNGQSNIKKEWHKSEVRVK